MPSPNCVIPFASRKISTLVGNSHLKPIPNFIDYAADEEGNIWSLKCGKIKKLRLALSRYGYLRVLLCGHSGHKFVAVHRMVLLAFRGEGLPGQECRHIDGNRVNNRISNLAWGTKKENCADRVIHGTAPIGSRNGNCKLNDSDVLEIISLLKSGNSLASIGRKFGVNKTLIHKIKKGENWTHLTGINI